MANRNGFVKYVVLAAKILCLFIVISVLLTIDIPLAVGTIQNPTEIPESREPVVIPPSSQNPDDYNDKSQEENDKKGEQPNETGDSTEEPDDPVVDDAPDNPNEDDDTEDPEEQPEINKYEQAAMESIFQRQLNNLYGRNEDKVAYLTFDDGPTKAFTNAILDILAEEGVKATFFLIGTQVEQYPEIVKRQYEEGHGIGNHTYSHVFRDIYKNPNRYTKELRRMEKLIQSTLNTDKRFRLTRFPGGSFGDALASFRRNVNEEGFVYIDWNCVNGDAESLDIKRPEELIKRVKDTVNGQTSLIVLMHDSMGKQTTVEALPEIISYLRLEGYRFELLPASRGF